VNYNDSVQFLYALGNEMKTAKLGLDRIHSLMEALGHPERSYRVVHVAGTNGKGSTCAMVEAGLRAVGVRTGLFTSPHLVEPTERIQVDGIPVSPQQFAKAFDVVHQAALELGADVDPDDHPSYFETVTAMGFWLFRELGVETAVVEVGLGGRLDATNVVQPAVTAITSIDFDHQAYLGTTLESIAREKAGILKRGVPAVFAPQRPEARAVLEQRAAALGISYKTERDFGLRDLELDARGSRFRGERTGWIECPLAGEHQVENAVTAAMVLETLGVSPTGTGDARWPGRMEFVSPNPDILLDGAHNPAGARALARYLERFYPDRRCWILFGAMRDKAIEESGSLLFHLADEIIFTAPNTSRAVTPDGLLEMASHLPAIAKPVRLKHPPRTAANVVDALQMVFKDAHADDLVVITGSLFLVGEARAAAYNKSSWPFSGAWA
jgi:dihydrofolate synthase/folylpolyglutamate synthase